MYPGVGGALLPPLLLAMRVCSVCKGEGGEIKLNSIYFSSRLIAHGENVQYRLIKNN